MRPSVGRAIARGARSTGVVVKIGPTPAWTPTNIEFTRGYHRFGSEADMRGWRVLLSRPTASVAPSLTTGAPVAHARRDDGRRRRRRLRNSVRVLRSESERRRVVEHAAPFAKDRTCSCFAAAALTTSASTTTSARERARNRPRGTRREKLARLVAPPTHTVRLDRARGLSRSRARSSSPSRARPRRPRATSRTCSTRPTNTRSTLSSAQTSARATDVDRVHVPDRGEVVKATPAASTRSSWTIELRARALSRALCARDVRAPRASAPLSLSTGDDATACFRERSSSCTSRCASCGRPRSRARARRALSIHYAILAALVSSASRSDAVTFRDPARRGTVIARRCA